MKKIIILLFLFSSCSTLTTQDTRLPASEDSPDKIERKYEYEIATFQVLVEEALVWRAQAIRFLEENEKALKQKNQLSHEAMLKIFKSKDQYLLLQDKLLEVVEKNRLPERTSIKFVPGSRTQTMQYGSHDPVTGHDDIRFVMRLDPLDDEGKEMLLKMKLNLSASTVLYDNYMMGIYPYEKNRKARRLLNWDTDKKKRALEKMTDDFFSLQKRLEFLTAAKLFKESEEYYRENKDVNTTENQKYLSELILQSPVYNFMNTGKNLTEQPNLIRAFGNRLYDRARFLVDSLSYFTSMGFGNTMGLVSSRKGKLKSLSEEEKNAIKGQMRPLDILLEKTPFRLTDKFIPGYYGHVAIWVGNKEQLQELGVWDHPLVAKYHEKIEKGHFIVEALRPGVEINTLDHFLDIDDMLVLRDTNLVEQKKEFIIRTFAQIGKDYDFNFDVETDDKIVCSEIVYVVFHDIEWPTSKSLGRFTISPDNVATKALGGGPLEPVLIYASGIKQSGNLRDVLETILK